MNNSESNVNGRTTSKNSTTPVIRDQVIRGTRYAYEDYPYWDTIKKQTRHKRKYIGHYDDKGNLIPSKNQLVKRQDEINSENNLNNSINSYKFIGATYLLDQIALKIGLKDDLKELFPDNYLKIISLSYYLTLENENSFYRFKKWSLTHHHPYNKEITSQRVSDLLTTITENDKLELFKRQANRIQENESLAYDTTSISSYSEIIKQEKLGHNKDGDDLAQINLALVLSEKSLLPAYYKILPSNINDVTTLEKLLTDINKIGIKDAKFVLDSGYYSANNIFRLHKNGYKYIVGIKNNITYVSKRIAELDRQKFNKTNFIPTHEVYYHSYEVFVPIYTNNNSFNLINIQKVKSYLHIYFDPYKANVETVKFNKKLHNALDKLKDGTATINEKNLLTKFCTFNYTQNTDSFAVNFNTDIINNEISKFGYFSLLSNMKLTSKKILEIYREKDVIEKSFNNLKNRLNLQQKSVYSYKNLEGEIFLQYISLIFIFYIHKHMKINNLYKNYSLETFLDQLDTIAIYDYKNSGIHYSEITKKQIELYKYMDVTPLNQ
jgi:transposase